MMMMICHGRCAVASLEVAGYNPGARFTKYLTIMLRQCQSYDRPATDVYLLTNDARLFLGMIQSQNRKVV